MSRYPRVFRVSPDPLSYIFLGLFLLIFAFTLLLMNLGVSNMKFLLAFCMIGVGLVLALDFIVRLLFPWWGRKPLSYAVVGIILVAAGASTLLGFRKWWPLIPVALGTVSLTYGVIKSLKAVKS